MRLALLLVLLTAPLARAVPFATFTRELTIAIDASTPHPRLREAFEAFASRHSLPPTDALWRDYRRVRTVFELTRDAGPWRLRWTITDREPSSRAIWQAWQRGLPTEAGAPTADAECDELSALTGFLSRRIGARNVGIFWPSSNHAIAAWEAGTAKHPVRVLLPTTQVYLSCTSTFDVTPFDPTRQRTVYEYAARDVADDFAIPAATAAFLLEETRAWAGASPELLALARLHRGRRFDTSLQPCRGESQRLAELLRSEPISDGDARALAHATRELALSEDTPLEQALAKFAE